ncbi:unnamed protein product [Clavelina lepadiformis]|uniref:Uncharacterized protein n=1 Tax=Clavelina lepadiformis TaxID=159417 RepID=A0ABP0GI92_CLALP
MKSSIVCVYAKFAVWYLDEPCAYHQTPHFPLLGPSTTTNLVFSPLLFLCNDSVVFETSYDCKYFLKYFSRFVFKFFPNEESCCLVKIIDINYCKKLKNCH